MYQGLNKRILILEKVSFDTDCNTNDYDESLKLSLEDNGFNVDLYNDPFLALQSFHDGIYCMIIILMKLTKNESSNLYNKFKSIDKKIRICFLDK